MEEMIMKIIQPEVVNTIFWSGIIFLLLCQFLGMLILKRFFHFIEERDERTVGDATRAAKTTEKASVLQLQIESQLIEAQIKAMRTRDQLVISARAEHDRVLAQATEDSSQKMAAARAKIASARDNALQSSSTASSEIASIIVSKLVSNNNTNQTKLGLEG